MMSQSLENQGVTKLAYSFVILLSSLIFFTTILKLCGFQISSLMIILLLVPHIIVFRLLGILPPRKTLFVVVGIFFVLMIAVLMTVPKFLVREVDYFSENAWENFAESNRENNGGVKSSLSSVAVEGAWQREPLVYVQDAPCVKFEYQNSGSEKVRRTFKYILKNLADEELELHCSLNGKFLRRVTVPAKYDPKTRFHDYPSNNYLLSIPVFLSPGSNSIQMECVNYSTLEPALKGKVEISDLTLLDKKDFYAFIGREYMVADLADIREQMNVIANLKKHLYLGETVVNPEHLVQGAPRPAPISILPLYYYAANFFTVFFSNPIMGLNYLQLLLLSFIVFISFSLCRPLCESRLEVAFVCMLLMATSFNYMTLISRWAAEGIYEDTFLSLFVLLLLYGLLEKQMVLSVISSLFICLTRSVGLVLVALIFISFYMVQAHKKFVTKVLRYAGVSFLLVGTFVVLAGVLWGFLSGWKEELIYEFFHRFSLFRIFLHNKSFVLSILIQKTYLLLVLSFFCSGFVGLWGLRKRRVLNVCFLFPVLYIIAVALLNGFRSYYLAPIVFPVAVFGVQSVLSVEGGRKRFLVLVTAGLMAVFSAVCAAGSNADYTDNTWKNNTWKKYSVYGLTVYDKVSDYLRRIGDVRQADICFIDESREKELINHHA